MHVHLGRLVIVQFFPNVGLVLGRQAGPGFVRSAVILVTRRHFDVVVEFDNLKIKSLIKYTHNNNLSFRKKCMI